MSNRGRRWGGGGGGGLGCLDGGSGIGGKGMGMVAGGRGMVVLWRGGVRFAVFMGLYFICIGLLYNVISLGVSSDLSSGGWL
jgi:hypothetical protein